MTSWILFHIGRLNECWRRQNYSTKMQVLTTFLFTMATLLLLSTAVKASPVLVMGDDESSPKDLTGLGAEQSKQFKRICGMSFYCQRFTVKRIVTKFSICFRITNIHFFSFFCCFVCVNTLNYRLENTKYWQTQHFCIWESQTRAQTSEAQVVGGVSSTRFGGEFSWTRHMSRHLS